MAADAARHSLVWNVWAITRHVQHLTKCKVPEQSGWMGTLSTVYGYAVFLDRAKYGVAMLVSRSQTLYLPLCIGSLKSVASLNYCTRRLVRRKWGLPGFQLGVSHGVYNFGSGVGRCAFIDFTVKIKRLINYTNIIGQLGRGMRGGRASLALPTLSRSLTNSFWPRWGG